MGAYKREKNLTKKGLGIYSAAFIITALFCYVLFIIKGISFLKFGSSNVDGLTQTYPAYVAIRHMIQDLLAGRGIDAWNWSLGLGADNFEYFGSKLLNPLTYLIILFPDDKIDMGYTIATVLRQYFAGLCFFLCMREVKLGWKQSVAGGLSFAFCGWVLGTALNQGSFCNAAIVLPLLIMGTEKIFKGKSPALFILSVAFCVTTGVTWTYITGIVAVGYYLARYHDYHSGEGFGSFAKNLGSFVLYGISGILISAPFILSMLCSMTSATTDTEANSRTLAFALDKYLSIPEGLFRTVEVGAVSYSYICISIICILLIPMAIKNAKKIGTAAWLAIGLSFAAMFPFTSKFFNGFSYPAGRWYYVLCFFIIWACVECLNKETLGNKKNLIVMGAWLILLVLWVGAMCFVIDIGSKGAVLAALSGGFYGVMLLVCIWLYYFKCNKGRTARLVECIGALVLIASIACSANIKLLGGDYIGDHLKLGKAAEKISAISERAVDELYAEDEDFYRTDISYRSNSELHSKMRANSNLIYGNRSVYTYSSLIDSRWNKFCSVIGNNYGCFARLAVMSNDNRAYADFLTGVKYYLGSSEYEKNASDYAGYDFEKYADIDGVEVLKAGNSIGIGAPFTEYISESELMTAPQLVRDQIMMQAVVVPDSKVDELDGAEHADVSRLETGISTVKSDIKAGKNTELDKANRTITVKGNKGHLTVSCDKAEKCQLVLSFEGIKRAPKTYEEHLQYDKARSSSSATGELIKKASYRDRGAFTITAEKGNIKKYSYCEKDSTRGFNDVYAYNINLGYYDSVEGDIEISLSESGIYSYDSICVYAIPMNVYDQYAKKLDSSKLQLTEWDNDRLSGKVTAKENGILFLSIPYKEGWRIKVDGRDAQIINADIAFMGVEVSAGEHDIELSYSHWGMKPALLVSLLGVIMTGIILIKRRKMA